MDAGGFGFVMLSRIALGWRVFGTGLGFIAVGIGGVSLFPLLNVCIRSPQRRSEVARRAIKITFRCIVGLMRVLGVFRYDVNGLERLTRRGLLILANHPTLIDIVFLIAFVERADCIVKSGLWRNPFTRGTVQAAGYIRNDDNGVRVLEDCVESVRRGNNLIIFPEGTRTPADGLIRLKRGAANIAVRAPCNITPVFIHCVPPMLTKGEKWWRLPLRTAHFRIDVKDDIDVRSFVAASGSNVLAARRLTAHLHDYFIKEIQLHALA
jgi:1-acyl-sn-glycerol-3-phosphate acyltransferase